MACTGCSRCNLNIAGAGVLVLTKSKKFESEYDCILVKDYTGDFNDFGGKSEGRESSIVAQAELLEESRGTICIDSSALHTTRYVDIGHTKHVYRCYVVIIPNVSCTTFYRTNTSGMSSAYRETTEMQRFPVRYIYDCLRTDLNDGKLYDDDCVKKPINDRLKAIIRKIFR